MEKQSKTQEPKLCLCRTGWEWQAEQCLFCTASCTLGAEGLISDCMVPGPLQDVVSKLQEAAGAHGNSLCSKQTFLVLHLLRSPWELLSLMKHPKPRKYSHN